MTKGCSDSILCESCKNREFSIFTGLNQEDKDLLESGKITCEYKKGETIFKEGMKPTGMICLQVGKVKLFKEGIGGKEQIIRLVNSIELVGYRALLADENHTTTAIAIEDSIVCHIDKEKIFDVLNRNNELAMKIIKRLAKELGNSKNRIVNLTQKHVRGRLAEALLILKDTYGENELDGYLDVALGRNDLADLANMTTSNASRTLSAFSEEELVEVKGRKIKLLDADKITQISNYG
jgi:CRP-like cAMP-binding protein